MIDETAMNSTFFCVTQAWRTHESELRGYLMHRLGNSPLAEGGVAASTSTVLRRIALDKLARPRGGRRTNRAGVARAWGG